MRTLDLDQYWPSMRGADARVGQVSVAPESSVHAAHAQETSVEEALVEFTTRTHDLINTRPNTEPHMELRDRKMPIVWGGLGFLAGMCAWHMVGFWTFVSHVAFNDDARVTAMVQGSQPNAAQPEKLISKVTGSTPDQATHGNCIALAINREGGNAIPGTCPVDKKPLADAGRTRRDDLARSSPRLQDPQSWADVTAVESKDAGDAIDASVFDLSIKAGP